MAPSKANNGPLFVKDEQCMCFHGEYLYEAKILDVRTTDDPNVWQYKIHYKGWKATWDDWVEQDRVRKLNAENIAISRKMQLDLVALIEKERKKKPTPTPKGKKGAKAGGSDFSSARGSEERHTSSAAPGGRGPRRGKDYDLETEEAFHERPSIKLIVPDPLKALLVGDWENITRNNQLVPLPKAKPVRVILEDYLRLESAKRTEQAQVDVLEEIIQGLGVYFDQCLGRVLLYSFERCQYIELTEQRQADEGELAGLTERDIYGAEHLARLIVALPEMIVQTNMDQQSTNRLRDELKRFCIWLSIEAHNYFSANYETPNQAYIDKARTTQN